MSAMAERRPGHHRQRHHADRADRPDMHADRIGNLAPATARSLPPRRSRARPGGIRRAAPAPARRGGPQSPASATGARDLPAPAASASAPVATPSGAATQATSASARQRQHDSVGPPERRRPRARAHAGDPVAGEARRHPPADQQDQHDDEAERGADRKVRHAVAGVLDMEGDVGEAERQRQRGDLEVSPVPAGDHLARDKAANTTRNPASIDRGGRAADRGRDEHGDAPRRPKRREARRGERRPPASGRSSWGSPSAGSLRPPRRHSRRSSRGRASRPPRRRSGSRPRRKIPPATAPCRQRPDACAEEERPEAAAEQRRAPPGAGGLGRTMNRGVLRGAHWNDLLGPGAKKGPARRARARRRHRSAFCRPPATIGESAPSPWRSVRVIQGGSERASRREIAIDTRRGNAAWARAVARRRLIGSSCDEPSAVATEPVLTRERHGSFRPRTGTLSCGRRCSRRWARRFRAP